MSIKSKADLKNRFKKGDKPTQQDFADVIDSSVSTINGTAPDALGNVDLPNTSQSVQANLTAHEALVGNDKVIGHLKLQDIIDTNNTNAITPNAVNGLKTSVDTAVTNAQNAITTATEAKAKLTAHEAAVATESSLGHVKLQDIIDDTDTTAITPKAVNTVKTALDALTTQVNQSESAAAVQVKLTAHEAVIGTESILGHLKLQQTLDDNTTNAIAPKAVNALKTALDTLVNNVTTNYDDCTNNHEDLAEHKELLSTKDVAGHIKLQDTIDDNTTNAITPNAVNAMATQVNKNKNDIIAITTEVGTNGGLINSNKNLFDKHVALDASETVVGHVKLSNSINDSLTTAITPAAVKTLGDEVEVLKNTINNSESAAAVQTNLTKHEAVVATDAILGHVKLLNDVTDDENSAVTSAAVYHENQFVLEQIDNNSTNLTKHEAVMATDTVAGHVKLGLAVGNGDDTAVTPFAVSKAMSDYDSQLQITFQNMSDAYTVLDGKISDNIGHISTLQTDSAKIKTDISNLETDNVNIKNDVTNLKASIGDVDVVALQTVVQGLPASLNTIQTNINTNQQSIVELIARVTALEQK